MTLVLRISQPPAEATAHVGDPQEKDENPVPHPQVGGHLSQDFPVDPVFTTPCSDAWYLGSIPGWGTKIPPASQPEKMNK